MKITFTYVFSFDILELRIEAFQLLTAIPRGLHDPEESLSCFVTAKNGEDSLPETWNDRKEESEYQRQFFEQLQKFKGG